MASILRATVAGALLAVICVLALAYTTGYDWHDLEAHTAWVLIGACTLSAALLSALKHAKD